MSEDWYFWSHRMPVARAAMQAGYEVHAAVRVAEHRERLEGEGIVIHPMPMRRAETRPWREGPLLARLARIYLALQPDIAHHVAVKPVLYGSAMARLSPRTATVNALAGLGYLFTSDAASRSRASRLVRWALPRLLNGPRRLTVVQNEDDGAQLRALGVARDRIRLIRGSGVDPVRFAPTAEPAGTPVAVMVGRLLRDKGVFELVEAARILRDRGVPLRVAIAGDRDPDNPASVDAATLAAWEAEGVVDFQGHRTDIDALWRSAHIAVLPSYREGLPKALLEAAACGRPLVATDVTGCREIAVNGETAITVPPRDPGALADALEAMARDPQARRSLGERARALVLREFTEAHVQEATVALYQALCPVPGS